MERKIKFRAWRPNKLEMDYFDFIKTEDVAKFGEGNWFLQHLMQYTGLMDKNGKEIYEGDICSGHSDGNGKIVWNDFEWVYQFEGEDIVGIWEVRSDLKIVGNIYENPELLTPQ